MLATGFVTSVAITPDGQYVLSVGSDKILKFWDITTGEEIISMISFTDGEWVAMTSDGYFNHSKNGRKHIGLLTSPMTLATDEDEAYDKFYKPNSNTNVITYKFLKNGKVVSHWAKHYRGLVVREIANNNIMNFDELMNLKIEGLSLLEIQEKKNIKTLVMEIV